MPSSGDWFRPALKTLQSYQPGEWPAPNAGVLKLNSNENPYPPSPKVLAALANFQAELLRRYPDPQAQEFAQTVAETFGIPADWVIVGNGSDDVLTMIVRACAEEHRRVLAYPMPTYVLYRTLAAIQPAQTVEIPYERVGDTWRLPVEQLIATQAAVTLVATPNSPTGHQVPMADLRSLATHLNGVLVIDEAYVDFVGVDFAGQRADRLSLDLVKEFENVIVLRTLSKGYALAGLRVGFGFAQPALLAGLKKVKDSYNVDAIALHLGAIAIADQAYKDAIARKVVAAREQLASDLRAMNFRVWPSQANFLLVQPPSIFSEDSAQQLYQKLKARRIMIRYFDQPGLTDNLRITVGTPEQNARMVAAIGQSIGQAINKISGD
jgi:histidinol-phosphate aminotransferase